MANIIERGTAVMNVQLRDGTCCAKTVAEYLGVGEFRANQIIEEARKKGLPVKRSDTSGNKPTEQQIADEFAAMAAKMTDAATESLDD